MLLMRSAVAAFWERPYRAAFGPLGHRGCMTILCCRTLWSRISAARWRNFDALGFGLDPRMVRAAYGVPLPACRARSSFPGSSWSCGTRWNRGTCWANRQAIGGTVRYVDSSVERVQARVSGWVDERYVLACNGAAVPLTRTDREGQLCGRGALQGVEPAERATSDDWGACAAGAGRVRSMEWAERRRNDVSYLPPRRPELRDPSGQCERGGGAAAVTVFPVWAHAGVDAGAGGVAVAGASRTLDLRRV